MRFLFRSPYLAFEVSSQGRFETLYSYFNILDPIYDFPLIWEAGRTTNEIKTKLITRETSLGKLEFALSYTPIISGFIFKTTNENELPLLSTGDRKQLKVSIGHFFTAENLKNQLGIKYKKDEDKLGNQVPYIPQLEISDSFTLNHRQWIFSLAGYYAWRTYLPSYFIMSSSIGLKVNRILLSLKVKNIQDKHFLWYPGQSDNGIKWAFEARYE